MNGCRVGLLGFGTVGSAVARRLTLDPPATRSQLTLTHVFDRRAALKRAAFAQGGDATAVAVLSDLLAIARDRAAVVPAPRLSRAARVLGFDLTTAQTFRPALDLIAEAV